MKFLKHSNAYTNTTGTNYVKLEHKSLSESRLAVQFTLIDYAVSYDWYVYIKTFLTKTNKRVTILNRSFYSATTCKHINQTLKDLHMSHRDFDLIIDDAAVSLDCVNDLIKGLKVKIRQLVEDTEKPRTWKDTNCKRILKVSQIGKQIEMLSSLRSL